MLTSDDMVYICRGGGGQRDVRQVGQCMRLNGGSRRRGGENCAILRTVLNCMSIISSLNQRVPRASGRARRAHFYSVEK